MFFSLLYINDYISVMFLCVNMATEELGEEIIKAAPVLSPESLSHAVSL